MDQAITDEDVCNIRFSNIFEKSLLAYPYTLVNFLIESDRRGSTMMFSLLFGWTTRDFSEISRRVALSMPVDPHGESQQVSAVVNPCSPREMSFLTAPLILLRFGLLILARCIPWIYSDAAEGFWLASVIEIPTCALLNIPGRAADTFAAVVLRLPRHTTRSPFLCNRV